MELLTPIARLFNLLRPERKVILHIYLFAAFSGLVNLTLPLGLQAIINLIQGGQVSTSWTILILFVLGGLAFAGFLQILMLSMSESLQQRIFARSSFEFAYRLPRIKQMALHGSYPPELVNRFFDTLTVQKGMSKVLIDFSTAILQVFFGVILLSLYHSFFVIASVILLALLFIIYRFTVFQGLNTSLYESKYKYRVAQWLEEVGRTIHTFKLAGKTKLHLDKTDSLVSNYLTARKSHFKVLISQYRWMVIFRVVMTGTFLFVGGILVFEQQMNIGQFVAAEIVILMISASVEKITLTLETIYDILTGLEKLGQVVDLPLEDANEDSRVTVNSHDPISVTFKNVDFKYPKAKGNALTDINFHIKKGEKIGLVGTNGSGKSSLLYQIAQLYQPTSGSVLFNNIPVLNMRLSEVRAVIGESLQQDELIEGTISENISMGREEVDFKKIQEAVEIAGLVDFVTTLEKGYDTLVDPLGRLLPSGIASKILIARAIADRPGLLLLEKTLDNLELQEKERIVDYIIKQEWTLMTVTSDVVFAKACDRILVLDGGYIVDSGTFEDLIKRKKINHLLHAEYLS